MFTRGYAKHPCVQSTVLQGLSVGPSHRYPLFKKTELNLVFWEWTYFESLGTLSTHPGNVMFMGSGWYNLENVYRGGMSLVTKSTWQKGEG